MTAFHHFSQAEIVPNAETFDALSEYYEMKAHPERYKRYPSFKAAMKDVFSTEYACPEIGQVFESATYSRTGCWFIVWMQRKFCCSCPEQEHMRIWRSDLTGLYPQGAGAVGIKYLF